MTQRHRGQGAADVARSAGAHRARVSRARADRRPSARPPRSQRRSARCAAPRRGRASWWLVSTTIAAARRCAAIRLQQPRGGALVERIERLVQNPQRPRRRRAQPGQRRAPPLALRQACAPAACSCPRRPARASARSAARASAAGEPGQRAAASRFSSADRSSFSAGGMAEVDQLAVEVLAHAARSARPCHSTSPRVGAQQAAQHAQQAGLAGAVRAAARAATGRPWRVAQGRRNTRARRARSAGRASSSGDGSVDASRRAEGLNGDTGLWLSSSRCCQFTLTLLRWQYVDTRSRVALRRRAALRNRPHAVVIGSGFGGLAAAVRLGARGYRVTVLEKLDAPGGRAYVLPAGRLHLRRRPDHHHRALPVRGAVGAVRPAAGRRRRPAAGRRRSTASASTTATCFDYTGDADGDARRGRAARARRRRRLRALPAGQRGDLPGRLRAARPRAVRLAGPTWRASLPELVRLEGYRTVYGAGLQARAATRGCASVLSFHPLLVGGNPFADHLDLLPDRVPRAALGRALRDGRHRQRWSRAWSG